MGEIRYGPSGLPEAPTFEEAFAALAAEGYRACEIGFVSGFWFDYETAPVFGAAAAAADVALSVHAPLAAFMGHADRGKKFKMALGMLDHTADYGFPPNPPYESRITTNGHSPRRSAAITGRVCGRTPFHTKYDSAACSTSMPRPSAVLPTPRIAAHSMNGVALSPYIMS